VINLITGGSGFLGQHLASILLTRGERVRIFDINPPREIKRLSLRSHTDASPGPNGAEFFPGSVTDPVRLRMACEGVDCVFHMAANAHLWAKDKSVYAKVNYRGTRNVLDTARSSGVKKVVYTSSFTTLVGRRKARRVHRVDESQALGFVDLLGLYPRSKRQSEIAAMDAASRGMSTVIGLPTMPIGPGDHGLTGPTKMILDYVAGRTPAVLNARMNFIDVRDLADAHIALRDKGHSGERYILGGNDIWLADVLKLLERISGEKMPATRVPYILAYAVAAIDEAWSDHVSRTPPTAPLTGMRLAGRPTDFDTSKARRELGLSVRPLEHSLRDLLQWFSETGLVQRKEG